MAAPVVRYGDPRLFGTMLMRPFSHFQNYARPLFYPIHPDANKPLEIFIRVEWALIGTCAMTFFSAAALLGKVMQMVHYHLLSDERRREPTVKIVDGLQLPQVDQTGGVDAMGYVPTKNPIPLLRFGWNLKETEITSQLGEGIYAKFGGSLKTWETNSPVVSHLIKMDETGSIGNYQALKGAFVRQRFGEEKSIKSLTEKEKKGLNRSIRRLFLQNGFRALRYKSNLDGTSSWVVFDPAFLRIKKILVLGGI